MVTLTGLERTDPKKDRSTVHDQVVPADVLTEEHVVAIVDHDGGCETKPFGKRGLGETTHADDPFGAAKGAREQGARQYVLLQG